MLHTVHVNYKLTPLATDLGSAQVGYTSFLLEELTTDNIKVASRDL